MEEAGNKRAIETVDVPEPKKQHVEEANEASKQHPESKSSESKNLESKQDTPQHDHFAKGVAPIKAEYVLSHEAAPKANYSDDEAEGGDRSTADLGGNNGKNNKKKNRGQNKKRQLKQAKEEIRLCSTLLDPDSTRECKNPNCRNTHDVKYYLESKPQDMEGPCPVYQAIGYCPTGLKCRWLHSHYDSETTKLVKDLAKADEVAKINYEVNKLHPDSRFKLQRNKYDYNIAPAIIKQLDQERQTVSAKNGSKEDAALEAKRDQTKDNLATFVEDPFKIGEKKKLDLRNKKIVSPLTTVGNLPYRRLMKTLGADVTYSEMALAKQMVEGTNAEWALPKAHVSEYPGFGVQIATNQYSLAAKTAEVVARETSHVSELNLNCGCPIDLLYQSGQGSALLDQPAKLMRILKGMNASSGDIPVTVKIRMGTRDNKATAKSLVEKLLAEGDAAAITLHGRSRQQRYTKEANWDYVGEVGSIVQKWNDNNEEDKERRSDQRVNFVGNGDVFTHEDWYRGVALEGVDSVMVARGALIKPWIFEEIEGQQYLDKSSSERLEILQKYANFALEHWGTDEYGIQLARRFMCEFMSFTHRYIPVGILERLPPKLNQRPPQWKGRNELETLLGSSDYKDWIKITEMFLGKAGDNFSFTPKHKSNSHE